jgi:hypothetical protein
MARVRVSVVDHTPHLRGLRTPPAPPPPEPEEFRPEPARGALLPRGYIGRFPTVGLDSGAIPGTRPDRLY